MSYRKDFRFPDKTTWQNLQGVGSETYTCGYCGDKVSSGAGYSAVYEGGAIGCIRICPGCKAPTLFKAEKHFPGSAPGSAVVKVPESLSILYEEARQSAAAGAYTASVLVCRKMLMNIAVTEEAEEGKTFLSYVEYLADKGYVPPKGKVWVDYIRERGNEATHEIELMEEKDAVALVTFVEMLLKFIYEFPNMIPVKESNQSS